MSKKKKHDDVEQDALNEAETAEAAPAEAETADPEAAAQAQAETFEQPAEADAPPLPGQPPVDSDQVLRLQAELINVRRRLQREKEQSLRYAIQDFALDMLGVLDHLHLALEHLRGETKTEVKTFLEGAELIEKEFDRALARHDITRIEAVGQPFDPDLHEAVLMQPSDEHDPGTVIQEVRAGYLLKDRLIRPARVIVAKGSE